MTDAAFDAFHKIARGLLDTRGVTEGTGFGSNPGLRYKTKIFAMLGNGDLVVKLPKDRVDHLVSSGTAKRFDPRRDGRVMKEWATVHIGRRREWKLLADEALAFAKATSSKSRQMQR